VSWSIKRLHSSHIIDPLFYLPLSDRPTTTDLLGPRLRKRKHGGIKFFPVSTVQPAIFQRILRVVPRPRVPLAEIDPDVLLEFMLEI
jgi:hypothetical protein